MAEQFPEIARRWRDPAGTAGEVFVAAHRGAFLEDGAVALAENSIAAVERARRLGCDMVEIDLRFTADGVAVAFHDPTLERMTGLTGPLADKRWDELKDAPLLHPATRAPLGATIPRLEEVFAALGREMMVNIDLKAGVDSLPEIARIAAEAGAAPLVTAKTRLGGPEEMRRVADMLSALPVTIEFIPVLVDRLDGLAGLEAACEILSPTCVECIVTAPDGPGGYDLLDRRGLTMDGGPLFSLAARRLAAAHGVRQFVNTLYVTPTIPGDNQWNGGRNCELARIAPDSVYGFWIAHGATAIQSDEAPRLLNWLRGSGFRSD